MRQAFTGLNDPSQEARPRDFFDHGAPDSRHERITAERPALIAVLEAADIAMSDKRGERHATTKTFGQGHDVGHDSGVFETEKTTRAADPCLNLVENEQHTPVASQRAEIAQEGNRCLENTCFALDRLQHHRHRP
jgi:hypothetical protein